MSLVEQDFVQTIIVEKVDSPVGILFGRHAAIYFLHRDDPHFSDWLVHLEDSKKNRTLVRFTYEVAGQRLTLVEPVK